MARSSACARWTSPRPTCSRAGGSPLLMAAGRRVGSDEPRACSEIRSARESECYQKARVLSTLLPNVGLFKQSAGWLNERCVREHAIRSTRVRAYFLGIVFDSCVLTLFGWFCSPCSQRQHSGKLTRCSPSATLTRAPLKALPTSGSMQSTRTRTVFITYLDFGGCIFSALVFQRPLLASHVLHFKRQQQHHKHGQRSAATPRDDPCQGGKRARPQGASRPVHADAWHQRTFRGARHAATVPSSRKSPRIHRTAPCGNALSKAGPISRTLL